MSEQPSKEGGPAAGWYPRASDPAQERYWDGSQWTDHVRALSPTAGSAIPQEPAPAPSPQPTPSPAPPSAPKSAIPQETAPPPQQPRPAAAPPRSTAPPPQSRDRTMRIPIAILIVLLIVGGIGAAVALNNNESKHSPTGTTGASGATGPAAPTISGVSPSTGPEAGGTAVTITGAGFSIGSEGTTFAFGNTPATSVSCTSSTSCTASSPAGSSVADVTVTVGGVTSSTNSNDKFTYATTPPPPETPTQYLDETESSQVSESGVNVNTENKVEIIAGKTYQNSLTINPFNGAYNNGEQAEAEFSTTNPKLQVFKATIGEQPGESPATDVILDIRVNTLHGKSLLPHPIRINKQNPISVTVPLQGATIIAFVFTDNTCHGSENCQNTQKEIVFGEARFVE